MSPSNFLALLMVATSEYDEVWRHLDESGNPRQHLYIDMVRREKTTEVESELRKVCHLSLHERCLHCLYFSELFTNFKIKSAEHNCGSKETPVQEGLGTRLGRGKRFFGKCYSSTGNLVRLTTCGIKTFLKGQRNLI